MADRQSHTFKILLGSRERQAKQLDTLLAAQRKQRKELADAEQAKNTEIAQQAEQQAEREAHLAAMMSGQVPMKLPVFNAERQYREVIVEQRAQLETELASLKQTIEKKEEQIHQTQREIAKNKAQIESYQKLLDKIQRRAFKAVEDGMDEAAGEAIAALRRLKEKAQKANTAEKIKRRI